MQNVAALKVRQQTDPCPLGNTTYKSGAANHSYLYDANGNLQSGAGRSLTFNRFNMPQTVTLGSQVTTFGYGPGLERLTKTVTNGAASETTLYIEGLYERRTSGASTTQRYYVPAGDRLVAVAVDTGAGPVNYSVHTDRLGSMDVIANSARLAVNDLRFDAWGLRTDGTAAASLLTPRGYTGHELDSDSGLINMNARLYDPLLGRFVSADTVLPDPFDLQSLNRYSYVLNNPFRYTDPSGHIAEPLPGGWVYESQWNLTIAPGGTQVYDVATGAQYGSVQDALNAKFPGYTDIAANCVGQECGFQANILNYNNQLGIQAQAGTPGNPVPLLAGWSPYPEQAAAFGHSSYQGAPNGQAEGVLTSILDYMPALKGGLVVFGGILKWGDDVAKGTGQFSKYEDITAAGSRYANRATDVTKDQFEKNLLDSGFARSLSRDGKAIILEKDGSRYILRDGTKSTGGPTADFYKPGSQSIDLKIRLEQGAP